MLFHSALGRLYGFASILRFNVPKLKGGALLDGPPSASPLAEHAMVSLNAPLMAEGKIFPKGARGTIVHVYKGGAAYEVEFMEPFHTVVTVRPDALVL